MTSLQDDIQRRFGDIDIYVFDQIARGRITRNMTVLDAACGTGRNIAFLLRERVQVFGVDKDEAQVQRTRELAEQLAPNTPADRFRVEGIEQLSFDNEAFDAVIASAVLHFAEDPSHFEAMLAELWRVLKPGGILLTRIASNIGIEDRVRPLGQGRYDLPDGIARFLVDEASLLQQTEALGGELVDPIKTTNVQGLRSMTTWVVRKTAG